MIPVTIVTGFLGAGKSSLVAHLLDSVEDRRIGVIVNDLGSESIDISIILGGEHVAHGGSELVRSVAGGRAGAEKMPAVLAELESLSLVAPPPEAIVIETSGGSTVGALVSAIEGGSVPGLALDSVITVVDTETVPLVWADQMLRELVREQIAAADFVLLNKADRAGFWRRRRSRTIVRRANERAEVGLTEHGRIPVNEIVATGRRRAHLGEVKATAAPSAPGSRSATSAVSMPGPGSARSLVARHLNDRHPIHPARLHAWLEADWPGIARVKGHVWLATDMEHVYTIDAGAAQREVGLEGTWYAALEPSERPADEAIARALDGNPWGDRRQSITVIGSPDAVEREVRRLRGCLLSRPEEDRGPTAWKGIEDPIAPQFADDFIGRV